MKKVLIFVFILVCSFSLFNPVYSQSGPAESPVDLNTVVPIDSNITYGQFENGLRYYIKVNRKPEDRAELRLAVNAGSVLEDDDQQGLAHFCEHMAFNGTEHFAKQELVNYLESIGMKFGPEINAYTSFDETVYMLEIPVDSAEIVEKAFQILEDWAHLVSYESEEIDKERGVIREEWRLGRGAEARMQDKQFPILLKGSKYAERLPIGKIEIVDTCHYNTLTRFYKDWYRPDLMAVVAVGDFDADWIKELIETHFARIPARKDPFRITRKPSLPLPRIRKLRAQK
jgi:zinc protease